MSRSCSDDHHAGRAADELGRGAVITLDQKVGAPVSVLVNGRIVARGEVVVVDEDNSKFGVTLTEIVNSSRRRPGRSAACDQECPP